MPKVRAQILIVDDNPDDRTLLARYARAAGHEPVVAQSGLEALTIARSKPFDCILLDWQMPGLSGIETVRQLKADPELRFLPVIMLTGLESEEHVIAGLEAGADDFVGKSSTATVIAARIAAALRAKVLQDELRRVNNELARTNDELVAANQAKASALERIAGLLQEVRDLSQRDSLTNLYNHGFFFEAVGNELRRAKRYHHNVCCLMVDLDYFKRVNDTHGHLVGDRILQALAGSMKRFFREGDVVARYGGEEFSVLLLNIFYDDAFRVAERFRQRIESQPFETGAGALKVTVSIGVCSLLEDGVEDDEKLVALADAALYEAKARGRNNTVTYREMVRESRVARETSGDDAQYGLAQSTQRAYLEAVRALVTMIEDKDPWTREHSLNVLRYATLIARELALPDNEIEVIGNAAILHDLGKLGISDTILQKPGRLTEEEWVVMKTHPNAAVQLLQKGSYCRRERELILYHHERWDGTGYPKGLRGRDIPFGARVIAVADAYDAMRSHRHYREPLGIAQAVEELVGNAGTQFDPNAVAALLRGLHRLGLLPESTELPALLGRLPSPDADAPSG
jgi:diguanylate cyclase (GGDEF)-like protein